MTEREHATLQRRDRQEAGAIAACAPTGDMGKRRLARIGGRLTRADKFVHAIYEAACL